MEFDQQNKTLKRSALPMRKIFSRADGSAEIGLGHLVRDLALAQMLELEFDCIFFCKEIPEELKHQIQKNGFEVSIINSEDEFIRGLTNDLIVVLDHYNLDTDFQKRVKDHGCLLVCIDEDRKSTRLNSSH